MVLFIKQWFSPTMPLKRDTIICPDGGEISIDWADDDITRALPDSAPVLGILHTITGSSKEQFRFMHYAASRGWKSCVLNRRGHSGMAVRVIPHISIIGNVNDSILLVDQIRQKYPDNFIGLAGISAGSGAVVSYIGKEGDKVKIDAAASLCPMWDLTNGFKNLKKLYPWVDSVVTKSVIDMFLNKPRNQLALSKMPDVVSYAKESKSMEEFMDRAAPLAGCDNLEQYGLEYDPKHQLSGNRIPCLILNALDDFLCVKENIRYSDVENKFSNYILSVTEKGSHIAYNEGFFGTGNYMWRLTIDFFETVKECK